MPGIDEPDEAEDGHPVNERLPVACNRDCGGGCPLLATVDDGRVTRIAHNPAGGPLLKGCVRG